MRFLGHVLPVVAIVLSCVAPASAQQARVLPYVIENGREIPDSLTGQPGDAERGRLLYFNREVSGCSGCHGSPGGPGAELDAEEAGTPGLSGIASRMSLGTIRLWLVAPQVLNPETTMPSYYAAGQRTNPNDPRFGETRLSARQIEDLVAYLARQLEE